MATPMPEFDSDGYPTDETLRRIREWPAETLHDLPAFVCKAWSYPDRAVLDDNKNTLYLSTGGWSGNESIIGALQASHIFWLFAWQQSQRGGHYWFDLSRLVTP